MRRAGRIVAGTIDRVLAAVRPNISTGELDDVAEAYIREQGATPSFKGYGAGPGRVPFPASICTSINQEIVHGIPSAERTVAEGDLLKLDFGAIWEGFHGDSAVTVIVGEPASAEADKLVRVTEEALEAGISQIRPGGRLSDIGAAVEQVARGAGFEVVREYVGHGIGRNMHEDPQIPNYGRPGRGPVLKPGLVVAVEPMVNAGGWETSLLTLRGWSHLIMPAFTLALFQLTLIMRLVRAEMLEVLRTDYIKFARARGLRARSINYGHALKNTLVPVITVTGLQLGSVIAFAIITETVFQWPGMGLLFIQAVQNVDIPIMAAYLLMIAFLFVLINLAVDILYVVVDPRIRVTGAAA